MKDSVARKILEKNRQDYNKIFKKFSGTRQELWREFKDFEKYVLSDDKVLDAGCGNGRLLKLLAKKSIIYTGLDISDRLIDLAKIQFPKHNFIVGDITSLPFAENCFDSIFCIATLHHIPSRELRQKTILEFKRVLKKNGCLIMVNWNLWQKKWWPMHIKYGLKKITGQSQLDWKDLFKPWKNEQGQVVTKRYLHAFTKNELKKLLQKNGFDVIKQYYTIKGKKAGVLSGYNLITIAYKRKC